MGTRALMTCSAVFMLLAGVLLTFAPQEVLAFGGSRPEPISVLIVQAGGAIYMGFAMLNWMAKDSLIGGIYSRPVAMGNLLHFFAAAMAVLRSLRAGVRTPVVIAAVLYVAFAGWFGLVVFGSPVRGRKA